ncbi:MAG: sugar phosphate isomerase/epimerase [Clostridia bacterium]|nr:sugar phosphate isomerase/epimerase [Clostridia bacterium]
MIRLCAFADEADSSLEGQIEALKAADIGYIELRGINGKNISAVTEDEAREFKKQLEGGGIRVWSIGSPIGKIKISDDIDAHIALLEHICRLANIFECDKIRMFSFYEAYESESEVYSALRRMVAAADKYGVALYHENEKGIWGDTAERVMRLMDNIDGLNFVYDPANFIESGEDPEKTLYPLHARTGYFHIKDATLEDRKVVPAGYGGGRIPELVSMIGERDTVLSIEPHLMVFEGYSEFDDTKMQDKFVFKNNKEAFAAAADAIKAVITGAGYRKTDGGYTK